MAQDVACKIYFSRLLVNNSPVLLLGQGRAREDVIIANEGPSDLYVFLDSNVSTTNYTYIIPSKDVLEISNWSGPCWGIRNSIAGYVNITETV